MTTDRALTDQVRQIPASGYLPGPRTSRGSPGDDAVMAWDDEPRPPDRSHDHATAALCDQRHARRLRRPRGGDTRRGVAPLLGREPGPRRRSALRPRDLPDDGGRLAAGARRDLAGLDG